MRWFWAVFGLLLGCSSQAGGGAEDPPGEPPTPVCLTGAPAEPAAYNFDAELQVDGAGNAVLSWSTSADPGGDEARVDASLVAAWDGAHFGQATLRDPPSDVLVLKGAGRLLSAHSSEDEIALTVRESDCSTATTTHGPGGLLPALAANERGDAVLAWTGAYSQTDFALLTVMAPAGGAPTEPQPIFQLESEVVQSLAAIDEQGLATVVFPKAEPLSPGLAEYKTEAIRSAGGDFGEPEIVSDGAPKRLELDARGELSLVLQLPSLEQTQRLVRFDGTAWQPPVDYSCQSENCDAAFGVLDGDLTIVVERTPFEMLAAAIHEDGTREDFTIAHQEVGVVVLSHALHVDEGGAWVIWLTEKAVKSARFTRETGWSAPAVIIEHELERTSGSLGLASTRWAPSQYPMQLRRLADGRMLAVWSEYEAFVSETLGDTVTRIPMAQALWTLVTDGTTGSAERSFGSDEL